jgi:type I restriction enzyme, S subunit
MGLKYSKINLFNVISSRNLRLDYRFLDYSKTDIKYPYQLFSQFITEIGNGKDISPNNYVEHNSSDVIYPTVNNFTKGNFNFEDITFLDDNYKITKQLENDDIIISRSGTVGLTYAWNKQEVNKNFGRTIVAVPSGYLIVVKVNTVLINPRFIQFLFNSNLYKEYFYVFGVGKTQKNIAQPEILSIPIPIISKPNQEVLIRNIEPIEAEIQHLKTQIQQSLTIINEVFADVYGYDKSLWRTFGKGMTAGTQKSEDRSFKYYKVHLNEVPNSTILRFSSRFHSPHTRQLQDILKGIGYKPLKSILLEIVKGIQPKYTDEGEIPVAKIATLKNGYIDFSEPEFISRAFYDNLSNNVKLKFGDVLICCTGKVSLGKVDYYDLEEESVLTVDSYILRIDDKKYNPLYLTYFFRSILGAFQIERDYTGTTNQIHLYANEISNFQIPNVSLAEQEKIVGRIKSQLDAQKIIDQAIEEKQNAISDLILAAIEK